MDIEVTSLITLVVANAVILCSALGVFLYFFRWNIPEQEKQLLDPQSDEPRSPSEQNESFTGREAEKEDRLTQFGPISSIGDFISIGDRKESVFTIDKINNSIFAPITPIVPHGGSKPSRIIAIR